MIINFLIIIQDSYEKNNELLIIIITTVTFGVLGRLLVRTPYMAFGDFSSAFFISIALWWIYNSLLFYVVYQMKDNEKNKKTVKIIMYGGLATLIKAVIDTCIDLTVARQPNMLIFVAVVEISMLLYILGVDYFLFIKIKKRKIKKQIKGIDVLVISLCSLLLLYAGTLFYYMKQVNYVAERYGNSSTVQAVGLDNAIWRFTTTLGQRSTTVGTIVYVGGFILIWRIMDKITIEKTSSCAETIF